MSDTQVVVAKKKRRPKAKTLELQVIKKGGSPEEILDGVAAVLQSIGRVCRLVKPHIDRARDSRRK